MPELSEDQTFTLAQRHHPAGRLAEAQRVPMAHENEKTLPPFRQAAATAHRFLTDAEMDQLIAQHAASVTEAKLSAGARDPSVRRSQVAFFGTEDKYRWLYERVWAAEECNRMFFAASGRCGKSRYRFNSLDPKTTTEGTSSSCSAMRRRGSSGRAGHSSRSRASCFIE